MNELISRENLKLCPFCGGEAELVTFYIKGVANRKNHFARCRQNHFCRTRNYRSRNDAIEAWNKRAEPPADVPETNVGEYIDTGCGVEVIHTISQTKVPKHLKFTKDGEIVKDFILCKNPVGEVGYYEQVEGKFYAISEEPYKGAE